MKQKPKPGMMAVVKRRARVCTPGMAMIEPWFYVGVDSGSEHIILGEGKTPKAAWRDAMSGTKQTPL